MTSIRILGTLLLGITFLSACAEDTENLPSTEGVNDIEILSTGPLPAEGIREIGTETVDIVFLVGTCGAEEDAPLLPHRVAVDYRTDEITITIDTSLDCGSADTIDIGVIRAMRVHLTEEVGGREVVLAEA